jgi:hypothetical protein
VKRATVVNRLDMLDEVLATMSQGVGRRSSVKEECISRVDEFDQSHGKWIEQDD